MCYLDDWILDWSETLVAEIYLLYHNINTTQKLLNSVTCTNLDNHVMSFSFWSIFLPFVLVKMDILQKYWNSCSWSIFMSRVKYYSRFKFQKNVSLIKNSCVIGTRSLYIPQVHSQWHTTPKLGYSAHGCSKPLRVYVLVGCTRTMFPLFEIFQVVGIHEQ